ncbi:MAG TPA: LysR substrate-binding domain-containing protein [Polyangiales bacterium]|jgi:DNA-binding transcriptional LysR family regulator|nr:LysR substrate-binding domain-containing protein [Polyangiales bacterium]
MQDPSAILAFIEVVRQGSFRGAARKLGMSKSALSQRVAALEEQLGARLLSRTTRSVKLTDIGASYHREVSPAFEALNAAEARLRQLQAHPAGKLRITAPVELGQDVMGDVLGRYATRYPDVELEVDLTDRVVSLVDEGFDLGIRVGPLVNSGLMTRALSDPQQLGVFASPEYVKQHGAPKHPKDLAAHRCLAMSGAQAPKAWMFVIDGKVRTMNVTPHVTINSFQVLRALAVAGIGVVRIPMRHAVHDLQDGTLKQLLKAYALQARTTMAVYPSGRNISPALRAMLDVLVETFAEKPWQTLARR